MFLFPQLSHVPELLHLHQKCHPNIYGTVTLHVSVMGAVVLVQLINIKINQLCLRLVQTLIGYGHYLMENVTDVLLSPVSVRPVVSMWRRQCHASLYRVAGQTDTADGLHDPGLIVHGRR